MFNRVLYDFFKRQALSLLFETTTAGVFLHCDHDVSPHLTKSMSFAKETWAKQPMWYRLGNRTMLSISSCHPCFWCFTSNVSIVSVQNSPHLFVDLYTALGLKLHSLGFLQSQCPSLVSMLINTLGVSMLTKQWPGKTLRAPPPTFHRPGDSVQGIEVIASPH